MDAQQYSLSWNHFHSNLSKGFQSLLKDQDLVDVTLAVDGKYFKAHKMVLSICSPYFKELFQVNPCKHPIVVLQDVQYKVFKSLLVFMYQGEVKVSQCDLAAFMKIAEVLRIKGLTEHDGTEEIEKRTDTVIEHDTNTNGVTSFSSQLEEQIASRPRPIRPKAFRTSPTASPKHQAPTTSANAKRPRISTPAGETEAKTELRDMLLLGQPEKDKRERDKAKETVMLALHLQQQQPQQTSIKHSVVEVKEEPIEPEYNNDESGTDPMDHMMMDMSSIVTTTLGDCDGQSVETGETTTPGRVMLLKSRKGLPVLIHNGHIYTKHRVEPTRTMWLCVKSRILQCGGCLTTDSELLVLSYSGHNHRQLHDIIKRLQTGGSGSSNCGSSSNSSPSHSHDRHEFALEPTDLSLSNSHT